MRKERAPCSEGDAGSHRRVIERYGRSILVAWTLLLLGVLFAAGEVVLRLTVPYRVDYYTGIKLSNRLVKYPFGDMPFNSHGYPDREWDEKDSRARVGFVGDSVTMGFGAGYGYRYSDLVGAARTDKYYMNLGGAGEDGIASERVISNLLTLAQRLHLSKIVYGMNLNDIQPNEVSTDGDRRAPMRAVKVFVADYLDPLRSKSYLYNYFRTKAKLALNRFGYGYHGQEAFELHPTRNRAVVEQTVERIDTLSRRLKLYNIRLCVILLPYEMQISSDAASKYRQFGIEWSPDLLAGEPQATIRSLLAPDIGAVDLLPAFGGSGSGMDNIKIGQYFVYDKGDALDWNHPNRNGHRLIADYLLAHAAGCL